MRQRGRYAGVVRAGLLLGLALCARSAGAHAAVSSAQSQRGVLALLDTLGELHPALVHFPIALLLSAAMSEGIYALTGRQSLPETTRFLILLGVAGAVVAAPLGWIASDEIHIGALPQGAADLLEWHRWSGVATATWAVVLLAVSERTSRRNQTRRALRCGLVVATLLVGVTGYLGGELVHGSTSQAEGGPR